MISFENFIILAIGCSVAGFVDAAAGGGGLISLPIYIFTGLPAHFLVGTNKFTASSGAIVSAITFFKSGKITKKLMFLVIFSMIGSILGVRTVLLVSQSVLRVFIMVMVLAVGLYTLFSKSFGAVNEFDESKLERKHYLVGVLAAFLLGFYDGFFGPGTGSFLIMVFILYFKMDFITASGNAKLLNLASNITALVGFALSGNVYYKIAIPIAFFVAISSFLGSKLAIRKGIKVIKPIFVTMSLLLSVKLLLDMIIK